MHGRTAPGGRAEVCSNFGKVSLLAVQPPRSGEKSTEYGVRLRSSHSSLDGS